MSRRTKYDVTRDKPSGGWAVKADSARDVFDTKQDAVRAAASRARTTGNSRVIIRKNDGTIQSELTYMADPSRTTG